MSNRGGVNRMNVKLYWLLATSLYFGTAFYVLWDFAGPSPGDGYGSGYTPGLYLPGLTAPSVSLREYRDRALVRFQYRVPYFVLALFFTLLGGIIPIPLLRRHPRLNAHPVVASMLIALPLLLLGPAVLDAGSRLHLWRAQTWFPWDTWLFRILARVFLPLALLSGLVTVGAGRFRAK